REVGAGVSAGARYGGDTARPASPAMCTSLAAAGNRAASAPPAPNCASGMIADPPDRAGASGPATFSAPFVFGVTFCATGRDGLCVAGLLARDGDPFADDRCSMARTPTPSLSNDSAF